MTIKANLPDFASIDGRSALSAVNRVVPPWASLLLVVAIAWQIGNIIWLLVPGPAAGDIVAVPVTSLTGRAQATSASNDVEAIVVAHMFGVAETDAVAVAAAPQEDENLVDTRLTNLSLKGTVASQRREFSVAIIADSNNEENAQPCCRLRSPTPTASTRACWMTAWRARAVPPVPSKLCRPVMS